MESIYCRFGERKWLNEFINGNLRLTCPLDFNDFKGIGEEAISDEFEGAESKIENETNMVGLMNEHPQLALVAQLLGRPLIDKVQVKKTIYYTNAHKHRILCFYKLDIDNGIFAKPVDSRNMTEFKYDCFVYIKQIDIFLDRVKKNYLGRPVEILHSEVNYDDTKSGRNAFYKPTCHNYQNEYRICVVDNLIPDYNDGMYSKYDISVGSLTDITSQIYSLKSLIKARKFEDLY